MKCIVLDAMGVIFKAADDVAELLIPFVVEHGGTDIYEEICSAYLAASLGLISADRFWSLVSLDAGLEDSYLSRHSISADLIKFLALARRKGVPVWCLSNDVARWSIKLRESFGLNSYLQGSIISGDVGSRKPDRKIYELLVEKSGFNPDEMMFFDDRAKNISAAKGCGIPSELFDTKKGFRHLANRLQSGAF